MRARAAPGRRRARRRQRHVQRRAVLEYGPTIWIPIGNPAAVAPRDHRRRQVSPMIPAGGSARWPSGRPSIVIVRSVMPTPGSVGSAAVGVTGQSSVVGLVEAGRPPDLGLGHPGAVPRHRRRRRGRAGLDQLVRPVRRHGPAHRHRRRVAGAHGRAAGRVGPQRVIGVHRRVGLLHPGAGGGELVDGAPQDGVGLHSTTIVGSSSQTAAR